MNTTTALTEIPADKILKSAAIIKKIAYGIAGIGTVASYGTQVTLLLTNGLGAFSWAIPATIDMLAIAAAMALQIPRLDTVSRKIAGAILMVAVVVSILANVWDAHSPIAAVAHAWPVVAYLLGELLANRVRAFAERLQATQAAAAAPVTPVVVPIPTPVVAPVQVAIPLPTATVRTRKAPTATTTTRRTSHAACTHAATPRDRAVCRAS
jgi:hypothetical protein